jgi:tetratricopeptide (TPR) repeat protein
MLFDLSSPGRKTVVRIVYGVLALLFLVGFVGFGIGGEFGSGGIIDSLTGGGGSGSTADQYEDQIEDAEKTLESDPQNAAALAELARYRYLSGAAQLEQDETTLQVSLTDESEDEFEAALDAWERYLETKPRKPDVTTAQNMVQAYLSVGDIEGAADAQAIVAESNPSAGLYLRLALYEYSSFDIEAGDAAADKALAEAKGGEKARLEKQLDQLRARAVKAKEQQEKLPQDPAAGGQVLQSPFGGLGGGSAPAPGAPPGP